MAYAYFPTDAVLSLGIAPHGTQQWLEVALVGSEGMAGVAQLLGGSASGMRVTVIRAGAALRIGVAPLLLQLLASNALRKRMQRYVLVALTQMAQALHPLSPGGPAPRPLAVDGAGPGSLPGPARDA